jgi:ubiquinone/menaquinone biosynthesis C-methylase UbiE
MIGWLYDLLSRRAERGEIGARRRRLLGPLEGEVIELGAGTGASVPHYQRARRVVAVEPDPGMARRLRARLGEAKVPIETVGASVESLPYPDESFDAAVVTFVLCSVDDPDRALAEIHRVLRPGGSLVFMEHVRGEGRTGRWQRRLTPLHRKLAGNCHLDRETLASIERAGFDARAVERTRFPATHPLVSPGVQGVASKATSQYSPFGG